MVVMLLVDQLGGQLAGMVIVDHGHDRHLLAGSLLGLLANKPVPNEIPERFTTILVALAGNVLIEGVQQGRFQRYRDARQLGHGVPSSLGMVFLRIRLWAA